MLSKFPGIFRVKMAAKNIVFGTPGKQRRAVSTV